MARDSTRRYFGIPCPPSRSSAASIASEDGLPSRSGQPAPGPFEFLPRQSGQGGAPPAHHGLPRYRQGPRPRNSYERRTTCGQENRQNVLSCQAAEFAAGKTLGAPRPLIGRAPHLEVRAWNEGLSRHHHVAFQELSDALQRRRRRAVEPLLAAPSSDDRRKAGAGRVSDGAPVKKSRSLARDHRQSRGLLLALILPSPLVEGGAPHAQSVSGGVRCHHH